MTHSRLDAVAARQKHFLGRDLAAAMLAVIGTMVAVLVFAQLMRTPVFAGKAARAARPTATHVAKAQVVSTPAPSTVYVAQE